MNMSHLDLLLLVVGVISGQDYEPHDQGDQEEGGGDCGDQDGGQQNALQCNKAVQSVMFF